MEWERAVGDDHVKWGKSLEEKGVGGVEATCDYSPVSSGDNFQILECHEEEKLPRRGTRETSSQGGWKVCIGTEKERFPGRASEGRSNKAE